MGKMEYMKKKKLRVAIYCRMGNPADAGIAVEHTSDSDDNREANTIAGQKSYTKMETGNTGRERDIVTGAGA